MIAGGFHRRSGGSWEAAKPGANLRKKLGAAHGVFWFRISEFDKGSIKERLSPVAIYGFELVSRAFSND
jgi:hypothetical protein